MTLKDEDDTGNLLSSLLPRSDAPGHSPGVDGPGDADENPEGLGPRKGARLIEEKRKDWDGTQQRSLTSGRREVITYGRRLSRFLAGHRCYNPRGLDRDRDGSEETPSGAATFGPEDPSIDKGWSFFEHKTLPRHWIDPDDEGGEDRDGNSRGGSGEEEGRAKKKKRAAGAGADSSARAVFYNFWTGAKEEGDKATKKRWVVGAETDSSARTVLYDYWDTSEADMMGFGPGVVLYFKMIRYTMFLMICAGLIGLPNMVYYSSTAYSSPGQGEARAVSPGLVGSAVCTDRVWVACPTCPSRPAAGTLFGRDAEDPDRTATADGGDGTELVFRLKNNCQVGLPQGMVAFGCYLFLLVGTILFQRMSERWGKSMDKSVQTADDYTVWVRNPPEDARDPDEWRSFFAKFLSDLPGDRVTSCTVAVDNRLLLSKLAERMAALRKLELLVRPGVTFDPARLNEMVEACSAVPRWKHVINSLLFDRIMALSTDASALKAQIEALNAEILEMGKASYPVIGVFVTFETEQSMHSAMKALCVPKDLTKKQDPTEAVEAVASGDEPTGCRQPCNNPLLSFLLHGWQPTHKKKKLASEDLLFRGNHILYVDRPPPPSSICWENLGVKFSRVCIEQAVSFLLVVCYVVGAVFLTLWANSKNAFAASCMTSFLNLVVPLMILTTSHTLESHETEGARDASIYTKVSLFRWTNTVVLPSLLIPFTNTLDPSADSTVYHVYSLFFSQLLFGPAVFLLDPMGHFEHHILAPRAGSQRKINLCFQGSYWTLAERRTNATNIFFLACFYSILYPAGFFFAALVLLLYYLTDKFLLLRTWAPGPKIGGHVSSYIQETFLAILIIAYGIYQYFSFGGFPFDHTCKSDTIVNPEYVGEYTATTFGGNNVQVSIEKEEYNYEYCSQNADYNGSGDWIWMTEGQKIACKVLNTSSIAMLGGLLIPLAIMNFTKAGNQEGENGNLFKCSDEPGDVKFSEELNMAGYVPQIKKQIGFLVPFTHPFLACDVGSTDRKLIGWAFEGPERGYNLWKDFPQLGHCFDVVRGYNH